MCHQVVDPPDEIKAGKNCSECKMDCLKARPLGCAHACNLPCHPGPCPSCTKPVMMRCHCKAIPIVIPCNEWTSTTNEQDKMALLSCSSHCPKLIACGHPCSYNCHGGDCSPVDQCMHKVTLKCPCGRKKKKCCCHVAKSSELCCDEKCDMLAREKEMVLRINL
jgi:NF-X1-type zinc finger protein NFXL1